MKPASLTQLDDAQAGLRHVCAGFHEAADTLLDRCAPVGAAQLPPPFDRLLNHTGHMTTTLAEFHGQPVALRVLREDQSNAHYAREILLTAGAGGAVVEYGIARVNFAHASDEVREQILEKRTPLGDILIAHDVLRTIRPRWFYRFSQDSQIAARLGASRPVFGRVGQIYFEDEPAIELLEVVAGERVDESATVSG